MQNFIVILLRKKITKKETIILEARQTLKILPAVITSQIIFFGFCRFPDNSRQFRKIKIGWFESEKLAVIGEKCFDYLKRKRLLELIEKEFLISFSLFTVSRYQQLYL